MIKQISSLFKSFFLWPASTGLVLLFVSLLALVWANSSHYELYYKILHYPLGLSAGSGLFAFSLQHWVNDGLMALFFFVVGLEIKKELVEGELSTFKKAILPVFAAVGGMLVPAFFYLLFNQTGPTQAGWGVPMATDIAFAVGVLSLVSKRVPANLKVFLLALAIVDDLGAVLVIAFFYSKKLSFLYLMWAALSTLLVFGAIRAGIKSRFFYILCGLALWLFVLKSGVHATVAGVILGLICPAGGKALHQKTAQQALSSSNQKALKPAAPYKELKKQARLILSAYSPAYRGIKDLELFVNKLVMPLFAFFNAGVRMESGFSFVEFMSHPVSLGIFLGLFLGKPLGILLFSFLALRLKWAEWPVGFNWQRLTGLGFLAGIGFTMALFIAHLSFDSQPALSIYAKLSILVASGLAMFTGLFFLLLPEKGIGRKKQ